MANYILYYEELFQGQVNFGQWTYKYLIWYVNCTNGDVNKNQELSHKYHMFYRINKMFGMVYWSSSFILICL